MATNTIAGPDWESLAKALNVDTPLDAQKRAFEIAAFIAKVEDDKDSKLILKTGGKSVELSLKR